MQESTTTMLQMKTNLHYQGKINDNYILWVFIAVLISTNKTEKGTDLSVPFILKFHPQ